MTGDGYDPRVTLARAVGAVLDSRGNARAHLEAVQLQAAYHHNAARARWAAATDTVEQDEQLVSEVGRQMVAVLRACDVDSDVQLVTRRRTSTTGLLGGRKVAYEESVEGHGWVVRHRTWSHSRMVLTSVGAAVTGTDAYVRRTERATTLVVLREDGRLIEEHHGPRAPFGSGDAHVDDVPSRTSALPAPVLLPVSTPPLRASLDEVVLRLGRFAAHHRLTAEHILGAPRV